MQYHDFKLFYFSLCLCFFFVVVVDFRFVHFEFEDLAGDRVSVVSLVFVNGFWLLRVCLFIYYYVFGLIRVLVGM